jgi:hypothetical protein
MSTKLGGKKILFGGSRYDGRGKAGFVPGTGGRRMVIEVGMGRKDDGFGKVSRWMRIAGADLGSIVSNPGGLDRKRNMIKIPMREFLCI